MTWRPARSVTPDQARRAKELLAQWREGVIEEREGVQYRGAWHDGPQGRHHGVEVWVREDSPAAVPSPPVAPGPRGRATAAERAAVLSEGERRGWPAAELDAAIAIESGWDPAAHNKQRFGGLIGFAPWLLPKLGWEGTPEDFWRLSAGEQAPYVGRYFDQVQRAWSKPGDTYLALAAPAYVGAPDSVVVYPRGSKAWEQNPGWRGPDGEITAGSIRAVVLRKMAKMGGSAVVAAPKGEPQVVRHSLSWHLRRLLHALSQDGARERFSGSAATEVVRGYQRERGLTPDGMIGPRTRAALMEDASEDVS